MQDFCVLYHYSNNSILMAEMGELKATNPSSLTQSLHQGIQQYPACDNNSQKVAPSLLLLVIRSFEYFLGKV